MYFKGLINTLIRIRKMEVEARIPSQSKKIATHKL